MSKIHFFRHAQASFMADDYDKLSAHGEMQAVELGKYLVAKGKHFDKIFVGPLKRQLHTYQIVADVFAQHSKEIPEAIIIEGLKEHSGTEAMHASIPELMEIYPKIRNWLARVKDNPKLERRNNLLAFQYFMDIWAEGKINPEDIETWAAFRESVRGALKTILENTEKRKTIGVFTSGGTISAIAAESLKMQDEKRVLSLNFSIRNTSFSTFFYSKNQFNLLSLNEIPHLSDEMITFV
jgi:broad specificity phosphatase PhoE